MKRGSFCQCAKLTQGYPGSQAVKRGLIERFLLWALPHMDIVKTIQGPSFRDHTVLYLRRYYLWRSKWIGKNWGDLYLHHILRSDDDPDPHAHPWYFWTFILRGLYIDERWDWSGWYGRRERMRRLDEVMSFGKLRFRKALHMHRARIPEWSSRPVWTLVLTGPATFAANGKDLLWHFVKEREFVYWRKYIGLDTDKAYE